MAASTSADVELAKREKEINLRLKELELAKKEYEQKHRQSGLRSVVSNPAIMAALIAAWASLTATGITWIVGNISATAQKETAADQAHADARKFETQILVAALSRDVCSNANTLAILIKSNLITGERVEPATKYIGQTVANCKVDPLK
jgi:hypothetical protein